MSSDRNSPPAGRRASITGEFVNLFGGRSGSSSVSNSGILPGSIAAAAAQAQHQRRLSLSTSGLAGSPNQNSPFSAGGRPRTDSISSGNTSASVDESPFEEGDAPASAIPSTSFGRRLSFGARAMRDMRASTGNTGLGAGGNGPSNGNFDFAENLRSRAERTSISVPSGMPQGGGIHHRAKSISVMEPPVREMPQQPRIPDPIQERMLRGDFYMD